MSSRENNKRIAKNTLVLYGRLLFGMVVSLYTSRVILATLGVEDFGIYSVVAGVVVLFSFLNTAMSSATQRFLNFELGRSDSEQVQRVFSMSLIVHLCIAALVLLLAESVGLWFLNTRLNIPPERMSAANWVYQFSVAATALGIIRVPYNATLIAYEKMSAYAFLSMAEICLKLVVVFLLAWAPFDRLIFFAVLVCGISLVVFFACLLYCQRNFKTARYRFFWDRNLFLELMSFSGWSLLGGVALVCNTQGINMVMNIFCGVTVNAAMGVAMQVNRAVFQFITNFQTAFNPQIVKYYAAKQRDEAFLLIFRASKISFFLMLFLSLPLMANVDFVLGHWLKVVPPFANSFVCLSLGYCLVDSLSIPIFTLISATGKIKAYQLIIGICFILNIPLAYWLLSMGLSPVWVLVARIGITCLLMPVRLLISKKQAGFPIRRYLEQVVFRSFCVVVISGFPTFLLSKSFSGWTSFLISSTYSSSMVLLGGWFLGLSSDERGTLIVVIRQRMGLSADRC